MKRLILFVSIALCITILCACGSMENPVATDDIASLNTSNEAISSDTNLADASTPPAEGMVRSRLTNEWIDTDAANTRPIAVMTPNESSAVPHYNLSNASILYEANVEGRMTRLMAIYEDWTNLERIGNIRSLRAYYAYWAFEWDAFIIHFGGPYFINELVGQPTTENINGSGSDADAFYRTDDRTSPHNAYANGDDLLRAITQNDYSLEYRGLTEEDHFQFASTSAPNTLEQYTDAQNALYIDMSGCYPLTRCYFEYNEDDGLYYRSQHLSGGKDEPHIDAATGKQLSFKNILVQTVKYEELGEGYLAFQCHDTTRDGWFFTNGKGIHVTWEKTSDYGATRYYDDNGDEIQLNTGKTMICIIEEGDNFSFR